MEESERFNEWIEQGAAIYICGDEKCMAKDVHQAIKDVLVKNVIFLKKKQSYYCDK